MPTTGPDQRNSKAFRITPGNAEFSNPTRKIYVGNTGDLLIADADGTEIFIENIAVGFHDIYATKVLATSVGSPTETTTATALIGFY